MVHKKLSKARLTNEAEPTEDVDLVVRQVERAYLDLWTQCVPIKDPDQIEALREEGRKRLQEDPVMQDLVARALAEGFDNPFATGGAA